MDDMTLARIALAARNNAYAPYSRFAVGAALLSKDGRVFTGCNIENAAYSPTNCAERTAFFKAVSEGAREFDKIAVAGGRINALPDGFVYPCGVCRQVMAEFCDAAAFRVICVKSGDEFRCISLAELLPHGFGPDDLY